MAQVVVLGGGVCGLLSGMLLARDGHEVTVLERDPAAPPAPGDAWDAWERRSVTQFRQLHFLAPRFHRATESELPELAPALAAAGGLRIGFLTNLLGDAATAEDAQADTVTARRPVLESVVADLADRTPGLVVRRGVAVAGLLEGTPVRAGIPHVTGVETEAGERLPADLVVDAGGRRSPLPRWLDALGARPPVEEREDCGFTYHGRHFRSADGSTPPVVGPINAALGSISVITLPADNGTWGVGVVSVSSDRAVRGLRDPDRWASVVRSIPTAAHWLDGEPLHEGVATMAGIEDRYRRFVVDGVPVATGVLAVADAWACTNPSVGRGITIGALHALALRDLLRTMPVDEPLKLALGWDDVTEREVTPWYRSTLWGDRHRLAEMQAAIEGVPYRPDDADWLLFKAMQADLLADHEVLRGFVRMAGMLEPERTWFGDERFRARVRAVCPGEPPPGLEAFLPRGRLLELVG